MKEIDLAQHGISSILRAASQDYCKGISNAAIFIVWVYKQEADA
jgi:hypothetical protein